MIPQRTIDSLTRYLEDGVPTGGFMEAVLSNNLMESFGRADDENREALFEITRYIYNNLPSVCHWSKERYEAWIESKRS